MAANGGLRAQKSVPVKTKRATSGAASSGTVPKNTGRRKADLFDGAVAEVNRSAKEGLPYTGA